MTHSVPVLGVAQTPQSFAVPPGACDCHVHVFGPPEQYPFSPTRVYTPGPASVEDLLALQAALGLERVVIVHPSVYGADNRCTVDALRQLGSRARGVAVIDAATSAAELRELHAAGMRGVRLNLETAGLHDPAVARDMIVATAARLAPVGWHLQLYTSLEMLVALRDTLRRLPVPLVIDHFGRAEAAAGPGQAGFDVLLELVGSGVAYVKLSAAYRISSQPGWPDAAPLARALIEANPERVVWGSDWPHPGGSAGRRDPAEIEPFQVVDDGLSLNQLPTWTGTAERLRRLLVDNPARLYEF